MKINYYGKVFLTVAFILGMLFYTSVLNFRSNMRNLYSKIVEAKKVQTAEELDDVAFIESEFSSKEVNLIYILQWTSGDNDPFLEMGKGQQGFIKRNCKYQNCFVTSDRKYFRHYTMFDVIAFSGPEIIGMIDKEFPAKRSPLQKFIFVSSESSENYPICSAFTDGFFNLTWTYRLDSEIRWNYIIIRDANGTVIGPNREIHWIKPEDMEPVSDDMKKNIKKKTKAVAWFVSNCVTKSERENFVVYLSDELSKFNRKIDIYGNCGEYRCPRKNETFCDEMIGLNYFFYLALENSFSEDYVSEKILHALEHKTIPIVFGGANYSRFMPDGAYINARELGPQNLAKLMNELINDIDKYAEYFKWTNHYKYERGGVTAETDDYCGFCSVLNNEDKAKENHVYDKFREWWNPSHACG